MSLGGLGLASCRWRFRGRICQGVGQGALVVVGQLVTLGDLQGATGGVRLLPQLAIGDVSRGGGG